LDQSSGVGDGGGRFDGRGLSEASSFDESQFDGGESLRSRFVKDAGEAALLIVLRGD
jgi:hypothetical protein